MTAKLSLDDPRLQKAAELYRGGQSVHQIAPQVGVTAMAVHGWLKLLGVPRRSFKDASRSRLLELRDLNEHEIRGDVTALFALTKKGERVEILVDTADLPRLKEFGRRWWAVKRSHTSYAKATTGGADAPDIYVTSLFRGST